MGNTNIDAKSSEAAKKAKQFSPSVQYAIATVAANFLNGAFWGFATMDEIKSHFDVLKDEKNIAVRKLGNSCLVEVNPSFLGQAVVAIDPNLLNQQDVLTIQSKIAEAQLDFEKFLIRKGKVGNFVGTIGIYCVNDVTTIRFKGTEYPAFRVNMQTVLNLLSKYGYAIEVYGNYISPQQAMQSGGALWDSCHLSPTNTGVFINIKAKYGVDQIKHLEAQFKNQYNLK